MFCENINDGINKHVLFCFDSCFDKTYFQTLAGKPKNPTSNKKAVKKGKS